MVELGFLEKVKWKYIRYAIMGGCVYLISSFILSAFYFKLGLWGDFRRYVYLFFVSAFATILLFRAYKVRESALLSWGIFKWISLVGFPIASSFFLWDKVAAMWDALLEGYLPIDPRNYVVFVISWTTIGILSGISLQIDEYYRIK